jgi:helicase MOV-10
VLVGDYVLVKHHDSGDDKFFEGRVQAVGGKDVQLRFSDKFNLYKDGLVDVHFVLNRVPTRRMHQALAIRPATARLLFPDQCHLDGIPPLINLTPSASSPSIASLARTKSSFRSLLQYCADHLEAHHLWYSDRKPDTCFLSHSELCHRPGTGKTVTLVEAIQQLLTRDSDARILACAPSNDAADLIALKLTNVGSVNGLFRLNAMSRKYKDLPKKLREFSLANDNQVFAIPVLEDLQKCRVIVTTCISAGIPYGLGIKPGHFSHIFVDEAGQAMEPEVLIPIKTMASPTTNVTLAGSRLHYYFHLGGLRLITGDPKQLGPSIRSEFASSHGLSQSYLARLMARNVYDLDVGKGRTCVALLSNSQRQEN